MKTAVSSRFSGFTRVCFVRRGARGEGRRLFSNGTLMPPLDTPGTQPPFFDVLVAVAVAVASCGLLAYLSGRSRGCVNKYHRRAVRMEH